ncbi:MAG: tetratricopeptide repeat protein [candidate division KSB1 bacterium]|nr:tetratricopeptide repeat protein [candidate division KSB1 bacterium]MDZ7366826.1 tetratricopeptide repeat protein [candidate division KSB1 bacterium]MDZ7405167.1 tetratricopeptide repeat protein [candidate division KSB1 bacterium]
MKTNTKQLSHASIFSALLLFYFYMGNSVTAQVRTADIGKPAVPAKANSRDGKTIAANKTAETNSPGSIVQPLSPNIRDLERAIAEGEQLIAKYPDSDFTPTVMFQLVELYVKRSAHAYQLKMAEYDSLLKRYDRGEIKTEPVMPRPSYRPSIEMGYKILDHYPAAPFIDKVVYRIAICHLEENNLERAKEFFHKLLAEHPKSGYLLESHFRLGEYYFDHRQYAEAVNHYSKLLNNWQNPFFDMALYKLAWSYYNQNDFSKAISTFIYLIDDINLVDKASNTEILGKTKTDLRKEAIEYVAQCFADYGGARKAESFMTQFGEKPYSLEIFMRLAETYQSRNFYDEAIQTLDAILRLWPYHEQAPDFQGKIVWNYLQAGDLGKAEEARIKLVKNYGPGGAWLAKFPEGPTREKALASAEEALLTLATEAQARGQKEMSEKSYRTAIERYGEFLQKFPKSPNAGKVQYYQAECYYEIKDYANAAKAYHQVVANFPNSEFKADAAYNRILAHFEELSAAQNTDTTTFYLADFLGSGKADTLRVPNAIYPKALVACNDFIKLLPASEKMPDILMKYGESLFSLQQPAMAQRVYSKLIKDLPASQFVVQAHLLNAQCAIQMEKFFEAESWARAVVEKYPDSTRQVERAHRLINSAKFKLAEVFKKKGDAVTAAQAFDNIALSSNDSTISELALVEAALQYERAGNKDKAIDTYEKLYYKFPHSKRVDEALFKAAMLCEESSNWTRAAQNYLALVSLNANSPYAAKAVFASAQCYENAGLLENALKTYDRYLATYKSDPGQYLEALCRAGEICYKRKDYQVAANYFNNTIEAYRRYVRESQPVDVYMPAQAQFLLGEINYETYRRVNLEAPLDKNLKRKQALFNEVLADYKEAASYQVADWTTAASFKIGATFEEFARFFWESPRQQIAEDLMAKYEEQLQQKIRPFKEKAFATYQSNVKMAEENGVNNQWVEQSRQRMEALSVELGITAPANGVMPTSGAVEEKPKDTGEEGTINQSNTGNGESI